VQSDNGKRIVDWYPVAPELTHCNDIRNVKFELGAEQSSEGWSDNDLLNFDADQTLMWQRVVMTITAINGSVDAPPIILFPVSITFEGVTMLNFLESEFERGALIDDLSGATTATAYHLSTLSKEAGYHVNEAVRDYGAFCLWVSDNSPLVDKVTKNWKNSLSLEEKRGVLRHFSISSDEIGAFHMVCREARVERIAD
jgi:hypothetical protein